MPSAKCRRIGVALGGALARAGWNVTMVDINEPKLAAGRRYGIEVNGVKESNLRFMSFAEWTSADRAVLLLCTNEQDTATQVGALKSAGCERIFREKASGGRWGRPELHRLLDRLRKADVLVVWKLDRLSRSLRDVLTIMEHIAKAKAGFRSLSEAIDTTSAYKST